MTTIVEAATPQQRRAFLQFPLQLYKDSSVYVPELQDEEQQALDPAFAPLWHACSGKLLLALAGKRTVGRAAVLLPRGSDCARLSRLDFIDDADVSDALLGAAEDCARALGAARMAGPLGFTQLDKAGLLTEGFDEMGMHTTIYNAPYYQAHLRRRGYVPARTLVEYQMRVPERLALDDAALDAFVTAQELTLERPFDVKTLAAAQEAIGALLARVDAQDPYAVPLDDAQRAYYMKKLASAVNTDFVRIARNASGEVVALLVMVPSLARALRKNRGKLVPFGFAQISRALLRNDVLDGYLVAIDPRCDQQRMLQVLLRELHYACSVGGIAFIESGPILATDQVLRGWCARVEHRQHKTRMIFEKPL
nr:hypothetical protein [Maliibacterium massiliense]